MKEKHLAIRIQQCLALAEASNCPRRTFGALLVDPQRNVVLMDGYNGGPRGGGRLCGGEDCLRDTMNIESGTRVEIGCHHAEMNIICNAAANGVPTNNAWLIVSEPCMMCAKLIHHAGIERVVIVMGVSWARTESVISKTTAWRFSARKGRRTQGHPGLTSFQSSSWPDAFVSELRF